ncbi:hypothetical protein L3X38_024981 [Prunus dulcis]|uniref:Protein kinase domain-containing protein n=1 Tax=Prunus dulcis TaxID=3755 RepID=A0AAD4W0Y0_PRUDU|nr:hypothetical protein L3X38_024981 [Prunus dulcis]
MVGFILIGTSLYFLAQFQCFSSGESSFGLSYHGGKLMTEPVSVNILWFGTGWQESDREAIRTSVTSLTSSQYLVKDSEVPTLGNWWEIIRQYGDSNNVPVTDRVDLGAECFYTGPELNMTLDQVVYIGRSVFNKSSIKGFDGNLNCHWLFEVNDNSIYHIVFSYTVMFLDSKEQRQLMDMCSGRFQLEVFAGLKVNILWARAPQNAADQCSMLFHGNSYLGPPNGDEKVDSLVGYMLANVAEEVTNQDGSGWISNDGSGMTVSNSCASPFWRDNGDPPLFRDTEKNMSFNVVGLNGYRYIMPYVWDQKTRNCALKLSETCETNAMVILREPKGYLRGGIIVNHSNGLQPYPPNQKCRWAIHYPTAKFIRFTINYLSVAADSDDHLLICKSKSKSAQCSTLKSNNGRYEKNFKLMSSKVYIEFRTGDQVSFESRGWELSYSAGLCYGKENLYKHDGNIGYVASTSFPYVEGLKCQWVLHGKPGTPVFITFTHINISKGLDFLAIYNGTMQQIANFSGLFTGSDLPQLNLSGEVIIAFTTQTDQGEGWSANFYIAHPVNHDKVFVVILIVVLALIAASVSLLAVALAVVRKKLERKNAMDSDESLTLMSTDAIRVENRIGEGPSAVVYRAVSTDGGLVAIKSLRVIAAETELQQEIMAKSSSHPNIISFLGHSQDGLGRHYFVFEYMGRGDLSLNLRERGETLDLDKRIAIALQICSAIQMLHMYLKPPVYHGNITSENIFLDEFYNAKLGGFGAAKYCSSSNRANPEQLSEMAEDIWSFGLLLVELLRGEPLVDRETYKNYRRLEEINELLGSQECVDRRLTIPHETCKMGFAKLGEIAKWCIGSSWRVEGGKNNPKIGDVLSGLKQVKLLFSTASG